MENKRTRTEKGRRPKTSKYVGKIFSGWKVVHIGIARVQSAGTKWQYHRNYYYLVERVTSDGKCVKQLRLTANNMKKLAEGTFDIEAFADKKVHSRSAIGKTNYAFIDRN